MTFEEDFPSLDGMRKNSYCEQQPEHHKMTYQYEEGGRYIDVVLIEEFCLDKQKVRDAFKEIKDYVPRDGSFPIEKLILVIDEKIKELGL